MLTNYGKQVIRFLAEHKTSTNSDIHYYLKDTLKYINKISSIVGKIILAMVLCV